MTTTASAAGTFKIGGDLEVARLGYGSMRLTGKGIWGPPADPEGAVELLRRLPDLGLDLVDTADSYGPYVAEDLIHDALHPYDAITVATKGGLTRSGPDEWPALGRREYLRQCLLMSMRRLELDQIPLWQFHRIDPRTPREEAFAAMQAFQEEGKVRHLGLSNVSIDDIEAARGFFEVATVQNRYNLTDRASEDVLQYCEANGIGFIPWFPLAAGELAEPGGPVAEVADAHGATTGQVAIAWLLQHSPVMLPIPGTSSIEHLEENVAAAELELTEEEVAAIDRATT
jgi:aryl-alcohol dehydrogenase-like predicted oxidoreductase